MSKSILSVLLSFILLLQINTSVMAEEPPKETELFAKSAVLLDGDSGRVLYEKNGKEAMANASTTKILTCIVTLENCDLDSVATVSANAASQPKVRLGMRQGQKFYIRDLLYGLMLESFNDCAVVIAEHIGGTTEGFADMMNQKATEIGCKDSYFITPNGLDASDQNGFHHTTAVDLAGIMRYCINQSPKSADFLQITGTSLYSFSDVEGKSSYSCYNHNAFLTMMEGALSGKTGFTGNAGYCYVGALKRDDRTYIVALLACGWPNNKGYKWSDAKKLMAYGLEHFEKRNLKEILPDVAKLVPVEVINGQGGNMEEKTWVEPVVKEEEGLEELLVEHGKEITLSYEMADYLYAPVKQGTCIGKITYMLEDEVLKENLILAGNDVKKKDYPWCFFQVKKLFFF